VHLGREHADPHGMHVYRGPSTAQPPAQTVQATQAVTAPAETVQATTHWMHRLES